MVYVTAADSGEAKRIARTVVEERLAACANLLGPMTSIYRWEGEMREGEEIALVLKTTEARSSALVERIRQLHSYACPCAVCLPITDGLGAFLDWIRQETG
jgi:periplasmic divalent cation tolerance protein